MENNNNLLVLAFKIPVSYISTELRIIKSIPNSNHFEISEKEDLIVNQDYRLIKR